jgi:hypothetical protein
VRNSYEILAGKSEKRPLAIIAHTGDDNTEMGVISEDV